MQLNPAQNAAVRHIDGPLLVLAGAGSGKTRVVTEKLAYLVERGFAPEQLLAITFTNKAAREMRERAAARLRAQAEGLTICTFHALGLRMMQAEARFAGLRPGFSVLDADESFKLLKELAPSGISKDNLFWLKNTISQLKNQGHDPGQAMALAGGARERQAAELYASYQKRLAAFNAVDFDDLIRLPVAMLEEHESLRSRWQARYRYLMVDEYQDTNSAQYRLLKALAGERGAFTAVGDDDQSIYAWRGADPENLNRLGEDYPALRIVKLEQNYRCAARILRAANAVIGHNPRVHPKTLWSDLPEGPPIRVLVCRDNDHEAERVVGELIARKENGKCRWSDCAVLYRGNHQARALEQALRLTSTPYVIAGGDSLFDCAEVKDALAYLRLIANPSDDGAFLRVINTPRREIGATTLERLGEQAARLNLSLSQAAGQDSVLAQLPARPSAALAQFEHLLSEWRRQANRTAPDELLAEVLDRIGYSEYLDTLDKTPEQRQRRQRNIDALKNILAGFARQRRSGLAELTQVVSLLSDADDDDRDGVRLMTLHAAKGLEFRHVALVGLEDGTFPHASAVDEGRVEEERRLFYVGLTRARQTLLLSYSEKRRRFGSVEACTPSRFLDELPAKELHWEGREPERDAEHARDLAAAHLARMAALLDG
ncbi:UvrD-helicase domain-containing protein [Pseudofulvimonas gallinarii]|uniref:ATP-dependent DNA helicase Rep n=1 Tax=Pseudofulvimonas gallinarii TaxID=634155 RepID=A0A4V2UWD7_9GAMM|nr:UvrD-helicase domain-containing protein [Pseudofulvimonas gallinarii]TCS99317.1 ATP-dependent DNA helicase Rep [Pseudofulvimonas gallinarii]THD13886.1 ATP-dependent DNA helicase Rep [Pseudofulvimonas gallinarii]